MKLTKREKIMLMMLVCLAAIIGLYYGLIQPRLDRLAQVQQKLAETRMTYQATQLYLSSDNKLNKDFKTINLKASAATQHLFPSIIQEKLILIIDDILDKSDIPAGSLSFTEITTGQVEAVKDTLKSTDTPLKQLVDGYGNADTGAGTPKNQTSKTNVNTAQNSQQSQDNLGTVEKMAVTLSIRTDYDRLMKFLDMIENYNKKIVVKTLNIGLNNDGSLTAGITLNFYAVPRLNTQDDDYLVWNLMGIYGSSNPFAAFSGYLAYSDKAAQQPLQAANDFIINAQPYTADMPAVAIGKALDTTAKSYLTYDSQDVVDVEFVVTKSGSKYYCKYKTKTGSMPSDYNSAGIEFTPRGSVIELRIVSNPRNSDSDVNGINLTIINNTDLTLNADIRNDDRTRSRVNISSTAGSVMVSRQ